MRLLKGLIILDFFVVMIIEGVAQRIESLIGVNCFKLSRILSYFRAAIYVWLCIETAALIMSKATSVGYLVGGLGFAIIGVAFSLAGSFFIIKASNEVERLVYKQSEVIIMNPYKLFLPAVLFRAVFLIIYPLILVGSDWANIIAGHSLIVSMYLITCNPLPPGTTSKLSKIVSSLQFRPKPVPVTGQAASAAFSYPITASVIPRMAQMAERIQ